MVRLNKAQLVTCWVLLWVICVFILAPAIKVEEFYRYKSKDGWGWSFASRKGELIDKEGKYYRISERDLNGTKGRKYYYAGSYNKYSFKGYKHPYERILLIIILNGVLLIYTLGRKKPTKTSQEIAQDLRKERRKGTPQKQDQPRRPGKLTSREFTLIAVLLTLAAAVVVIGAIMVMKRLEQPPPGESETTLEERFRRLEPEPLTPEELFRQLEPEEPQKPSK